jgi:hypothetical protein
MPEFSFLHAALAFAIGYALTVTRSLWVAHRRRIDGEIRHGENLANLIAEHHRREHRIIDALRRAEIVIEGYDQAKGNAAYTIAAAKVVEQATREGIPHDRATLLGRGL